MQRDLVLRWIERLGRIIARLLGTGDPASLDEARDQLDLAEHDFLGPMTDLAANLDPESLAALLGDPFRIWGYGQLVALKAAVEEAGGNSSAAADLKTRALALARLAVGGMDQPPRSWVEWIEGRV